MPHLPGITHAPALAALASELAHARPQVLLDDVRRAEELALQLEPGTQYPLAWVRSKITGYAASHATGDARVDAKLDATISGSALLADLGAFCEQLCQRVLDAARAGDVSAQPAMQGFASEPHESWRALRARLGISAATAGRLRRAGVVTRRVPGPRNLPLVCVGEGHAKRAATLLRSRPGDGGTRTPPTPRMSRRETERLVRAALRYRLWARLSLHAAAQRLSAWTHQAPASDTRARTPRSVEGLRALLLRDARTRKAFPQRSKPGQRRVIACAVLVLRGAEPSELATRVQRPPQLLRRDMLLARREALLAWLPREEIITGPVFQAAQASSALLAGVRQVQLPAPLGAGAAPQLRSELPLPAPRERELAVAMHYLRWQAAGLLPAMHHLHPSAHELDTIDTCLRGAWLLQCALAGSQRRRVLETLEVRCGFAWEELVRAAHPARLRELLAIANAALHEGVRGFDPFKGGRLAASCSLRVDRALGRALREGGLGPAHVRPKAGRATALVPAAATELDPLASALRVLVLPARWGGGLGLVLPPARVLACPPAVLAAVEAPWREMLGLRCMTLGADGSRQLPSTLRIVGQRMGLDDIRAFALQQRALRAVMRGERGKR